ncbi:MAG: hypothetical protein KDE19_03775 [Caldilineaceae bacterium]|nr:hypothetical protein [Caldilineaceae bacterium]
MENQLEDALLSRAVRDACQRYDPALRAEALAWLWVCCPDVAEELTLPTPEIAALAELVDAYVERQAA